jgi:HD superfamily phosphodiesterase
MNILKLAEQFAKKEYKKNDKMHQWNHIEEVMKLALYLSKSHPETDMEILKLAIIFHDINYEQYDTHVEESIKVAEKFLKDNNYPSEKISKVLQIMISHSSPHRKQIGEAQSIEEKIIFDSDKFAIASNPSGFEKYYPLLYLDKTRKLIKKLSPKLFK